MAKKFLTISLILWAASLWANPYTVVIDAGHGGKDAGAVGRSGLMEKNLNLDVSLRLASKIRTQYPEVRVLLTRSSDEFISLQGRADFVNKNDADLFICVHTNAADSRSAHGTEVFILGTDKMEQNLDVAMRENAVIKLEADYKTAYQGFDPNSIESYIMFELMQNQYMDKSLQFASLVQNEFTNTLHREDRGVRQAAFWVLLKSACPSVLVEMGFISNSDEEKYLASDQGKREITNALFYAFCNYYKPGEHVAEPVTEPVVEDQHTPVATPEHSEDVPAVSVPQTPQEPAAPKTPQPAAPAVSAPQTPQPPTPQQPATDNQQPVWRVQIFVSRTILPANDHNFKGMTNYTYRKAGDLYKYMVGEFATREEAVAYKEQIKDKFPDCFITKTTD